ncbi:MAG TPA: hydrogenase nickel incorporation protein HypB [Clostridiaceae bacterium]
MREIKVVRQIMEWNEDCHNELHNELNDKKVLMLNVMGSPGGGKTTLITRLIEKLKDKNKIGVIEADLAGIIDAEKMAAMNIPVVQLDTAGACHIEAMSIKNILPEFNLEALDIIFVENIGNLVCPAEFNIGEDLKIAILSIPEGDDKVEKYPLMFAKANALVLTKHDLVQYFKFDVNRVIKNAKALNEDIEIFMVNSETGEGILEVVSYLNKYLK